MTLKELLEKIKKKKNEVMLGDEIETKLIKGEKEEKKDEKVQGSK